MDIDCHRTVGSESSVVMWIPFRQSERERDRERE
jgi:hypothetical protein